MANDKQDATKVSYRIVPPGENEAEDCRKKGWLPGTKLVGDEGYGPTVIEITALGESRILAKTISQNGVPEQYPREGNWMLRNRDWKVVEHD